MFFGFPFPTVGAYQSAYEYATMATVGAYQDGIRRMLNDIGIYLDADLQEIPLGSLSIKDGCLYCGLCERNFSARDHLVGRRHRNFKYS